MQKTNQSIYINTARNTQISIIIAGRLLPLLMYKFCVNCCLSTQNSQIYAILSKGLKYLDLLGSPLLYWHTYSFG